MKKVYLDFAAATPMDKRVIQAMDPYFAGQFYNPSALYLDAKKVAKDIADARSSIARWLGVRSGEIIFTAGGTEANNHALLGVAKLYPGSEILASSIEHDSILEPLRYLKSHGWKTAELPVVSDGLIDLATLENKITDKTLLISVAYANNEIGTIQPIKKIAEIVQEVRKKRQKAGNNLPLYLHTDACQAGNYLSLSASRLGVDMMTLNGGKIYGPKQSGVLFVSSRVKLEPIIFGGGQEFGRRSGTENVAAIIGFAKALDLAQEQRAHESKRLETLQKLFLGLLADRLPEAQINGSLKHRLPNNVHITLSEQDNERLIMALDEAGIQAAAGSACSASSEEPSHVLRAIGLSEKGAQSSLRFTMGQTTDEASIRQVVTILTKLVA